MEATDLETRVLNELKALRKHRTGASFEGLSAKGKTICGLLGAGDAALAYNVLVQQCLEKIGSDWGMEIEAAITALGLASKQETVLGRLEEFASKHYLDQRQARRYSDQGLISLAKLIATTWSVYSVPIARITLGASSDVPGSGDTTTYQAHITTTHLDFIQMQTPEYEADGGTRQQLQTTTKNSADNLVKFEFSPVNFHNLIDLFWFGEMWPKWEVITGQTDFGITIESLGAHLRIGKIELRK